MSAGSTTDSTNGSPEPSSLWLEHAPAPMAMLDGAAHVMRYVNPAFCHLMEKAPEQLVGRPLYEVLVDKPGWVTSLDRVYRSGKPESHNQWKSSDPGAALWSYTLWPVMVSERPVGVVIQMSDTVSLHEATIAMNEALMLGSVRQHELTQAAVSSNAHLQGEICERRKAEDALQRSQAQLSLHAEQLEQQVTERTSELAALNQQLEAFVYSIAHDLRAPLRAMQGFSAMLVEEAGSALSEAGKDYAQRIDQSAQFMDAMLRDLLAFSRVSQRHVDLAPVNLKSVVESVLSRMEPDLQEKNARVEGPGPWPIVLAHEATLIQVLVNLVSNALKFVVPDQPPLVRLWAEERGELTRIWVEDNGIGIAPDHQVEIFRIFTRLRGEQYPGTGIGLAIVQTGVERMGGRVGVESTPGHGSRFWFELRQAGAS